MVNTKKIAVGVVAVILIVAVTVYAHLTCLILIMFNVHHRMRVKQ